MTDKNLEICSAWRSCAVASFVSGRLNIK